MRRLFQAASHSWVPRSTPCGKPGAPAMCSPIQYLSVKLSRLNTPGVLLTVDSARVATGTTTPTAKMESATPSAAGRQRPSGLIRSIAPLPPTVTNRRCSRTSRVSMMITTMPIATMTPASTAVTPCWWSWTARNREVDSNS